jgi:hypothetical protein
MGREIYWPQMNADKRKYTAAIFAFIRVHLRPIIILSGGLPSPNVGAV